MDCAFDEIQDSHEGNPLLPASRAERDIEDAQFYLFALRRSLALAFLVKPGPTEGTPVLGIINRAGGLSGNLRKTEIALAHSNHHACARLSGCLFHPIDRGTLRTIDVKRRHPHPG